MKNRYFMLGHAFIAVVMVLFFTSQSFAALKTVTDNSSKKDAVSKKGILTKVDAEKLVNSLIEEANKIIDSGITGDKLSSEFENIFVKHVDTQIIARYSLGVAWRTASAKKRESYQKAFQKYLSYKYSKTIIYSLTNSNVKIVKSAKTKRGYLVSSELIPKKKNASLNKKTSIAWQISNASGQNKIFDMIVEGISMLRLERETIGAALDRRGGNLEMLIKYFEDRAKDIN